MFKLKTGSYRVLEQTFLDDLAAQKKGDPLASVLVLSPSGHLLTHLQRNGAMRNAQCGLNTHFLTFYALAERMMAEASVTDTLVTESALFREIIHDFLSGRGDIPYTSKAELVRGDRVAKGLPGALASTLKDLQDSGARVVDCANVVREGHLGDKAEGAIPILELNVLMYKVLHDHNLRTGADFFRRATERVGSNDWIRQHKAIFLYGFYDLTGVQLDFVAALASHPQASLYLPYEEGNPAYAYAEKLIKDPALLSRCSLTSSPAASGRGSMARQTSGGDVGSTSAEVFSCSGTQNEVWWAAKKILEQADAGMPFSQMALVARTLDPYLNTVREVFETHRIPFALHSEEPVGAYPLIKSARQILTSSRHPGESRGPDALDAGFRRHDDINWSEHVAWAKDLLMTSIPLPKDANATEQRLFDGVVSAVESLAQLNTLGHPVSRERFLEVLEEKLEGLRLSLVSDNVAGVQVMDVMSSRGLSFDAVFVLGLNEKLFPRLIREDPFLSDAARSGLAQALGCRLGRKMDGFQEEKLLFELITQSASKHLHLSCQRSDEEGKALVVSLYLHDYLKKQNLKLDPVPRAWPERIRKAAPVTLTPKEVSIAFHREDQEPTALYKGLRWDSALLDHLLQSQKEIEAFGALGAHDGLIGEDPLAKAMLEKGLSPQTLKDLAECPFKVFSRKVLELYTDQGDTEEGQLTHTGRGKLIHKILQSFYQTHSHTNDLERMAEEEFRLIGAEFPELYPLAWQAEKTRILEMLKRFLQLDLADQGATGFKPTYFETPLASEISGIRLQGRIDRLDVGPEGFRVVDYKSGSGGIKKGEKVETAIMKGKSFQLPVYMALAKTLLEAEKNPAAKEGSALFYRLEEEDATAEPLEIGPDFWKEHSERFYKNLAFLVKNIESGSFYIHPAAGRGYCDWCDYKTVCRKEHKPSQIRAENSTQRKKHEEAFTPPPKR